MNRKNVLIAIVFFAAVLTVTLIAKFTQKADLGDQQIPIPTESQDISDDWNTYNSSLHYEISYPKDYVIQPNGDYSILILKPANEPGSGPANFEFDVDALF